MYHRIKPASLDSKPYSHSGMVVEKDTFDIQMKYLKENFQVLPIKELVDGLSKQKSNGRPQCAITFDDGWKDNFDHAFPILCKYKLPATIFLSTDYIDSFKWFWYDRLIFLLEHLLSRDDMDILIRHLSEEFSFDMYGYYGNMGNSVSFFDSIIEKVKEFSPHVRDRLIERLCSLLRVDIPEDSRNRRFLNWEEVRHMHCEGISFGSHGATHELFSHMTNQEIEKELKESKEEIETHLGERIEGFCYPDGNYNSEVITALKRHGFCYACVTEPGFNGSETDIYRLKRIAIHEDVASIIPLFDCRILGLL